MLGKGRILMCCIPWEGGISHFARNNVIKATTFWDLNFDLPFLSADELPFLTAFIA